MYWASFIFDMLFVIGGLVLYWLEYEVTPGMPEMRHWWSTIKENHFLETGMLTFGTWQILGDLSDTKTFSWLLSDNLSGWLSIQITIGILLLPFVLMLLTGIIKTQIRK